MVHQTNMVRGDTLIVDHLLWSLSLSQIFESSRALLDSQKHILSIDFHLV